MCDTKVPPFLTNWGTLLTKCLDDFDVCKKKIMKTYHKDCAYYIRDPPEAAYGDKAMEAKYKTWTDANKGVIIELEFIKDHCEGGMDGNLHVRGQFKGFSSDGTPNGKKEEFNIPFQKVFKVDKDDEIFGFLDIIY
ncbi:uncharacterized protein [Amphiura filiformis]|uniref:uncharacterized protein n=1 Tax=Amphiura filiformis TaxID=82378 RepID=UPI003B211A22